MIEKTDIGRFTFKEYNKKIPTKISNEILVIGTEVATLEGKYICKEESRLAIDINGNVYSIAESVFQESYVQCQD